MSYSQKKWHDPDGSELVVTMFEDGDAVLVTEGITGLTPRQVGELIQHLGYGRVVTITYGRDSQEPPADVRVLKETDYKGATQYLVRVGIDQWQWRQDPNVASDCLPRSWESARTNMASSLQVWAWDPTPRGSVNQVEAEGTPRGRVLDEARELIHGDRNVSYGSPTENFERIAQIWTVQLEQKLKPGEKITAEETALMAIGLKLARAINQSKRDNFVDIAGYAACGYEAGGGTE